MDDCSGAFIAATAPAQSADAAGGRSAILVLGMHRSGTSALTRVLNLLGAALPRHLLGAGPGNEAGHWEPVQLYLYHDRMLADLGSRWDDWRSLDLRQIAPEKRSQIKFEISEILKEEYGQAPLFVLKEPRICRFLPLYEEIFAEQGIAAHFVLPIRNPLAVAASLGQRNEMSEGFASLLWLRHAIDAERGTRGTPRVIVSYEALMADWRPTVDALGSSIPIAWPRSFAEAQADIGSFVDGELQHHAPSLDELAGRREIPDCVKEAYAALLALETNPNDAVAIATLDEIQSIFDSAAAIFGAATFPEIRARETIFARVQQSQAEHIDALAAMAQGREEEIGKLRAELTARETTIDELSLANVGLQGRIGQQNAEIAGLELALSAYEKQYADLGGLLTKQKTTESTRISAIGTLAQKLSAQESIIRELNKAIARHADTISVLTTELNLYRGSLLLRIKEPLRALSSLAFREYQIRRGGRVVLKSGLFDAAWYVKQNPDVWESGQSAVRHYLLHGGLEGRDPSPFFSSGWYLTQNPDVNAARINPLVHYLKHGSAEGRLPKPPRSGILELNAPETKGGTSLSQPLGSLRPLIDVHRLRSSMKRHITSALATARSSGPAGVLLRRVAQVRSKYDREGLRGVREGIFRAIGFESGSAKIEVAELSQTPPEFDAKRVIFISSEWQTPGHVYRVLRKVEAVRCLGESAESLTLEAAQERLAEVAAADIIVLWRTAWDRRVANVIGAARTGGARIVFDIDDLMFDPNIAVASIIDGIRSQGFSEHDVRRHFSRVRRTLCEADMCTATTEELAKHARALGKPTYVLPNGFDMGTFVRSRLAARKRKTETDDLVRIGYAAGTKTHQHDFATAARAISTILKERSNCRLVLFRRPGDGNELVDATEFPDLQGLESQIEWRDLVPLDQLPDEIARFDINIAPLELGNAFCEAKSELKFFEAALVDVPTIASSTGPFKRAITDGETGLLASDEPSWISCINQLLDDGSLRAKIASAARDDALRKFGPLQQAQDMYWLILQARGGRSASLSFSQRIAEAAKPKAQPNLPDARVMFEHDALVAAEVSVVVPLYNYQDYVLEALESVRFQTHGKIELIVIDDDSTDASLEVVLVWAKEHAQRFARLLVLKNVKNSGLAATRNMGFAKADAPYVLPLDPDNKLRPKCCETLLASIRGSDIAFAYPRIQQFGALNGIMGTPGFEPQLLVGGNYIDAMALVRREAWLKVGGYSKMVVTGWEDYELWCKFAESGYRGLPVREILADYRVHSNSMLQVTTERADNKAPMLQDMSTRHPWLSLPDRKPGDGTMSTSVAGQAEEDFEADAPSFPEALEEPEAIRSLLPILRCPTSGEPLQYEGGLLTSRESRRRWKIVNGRPVLFPGRDTVNVMPEAHISNQPPDAVLKLIQETPGLVLNLSAGGTIKKHSNVVEAEASIFRHTDVVADAHALPFRDGVFNAVVALNAFEHYRDPQKVAAEIFRVLAPGGRVFIHTAFLQPLHEAPYHFYNCTRFGLQEWFKDFDCERLVVSDNFLPGFSISWLASEVERALRSGVSEGAADGFLDSSLETFVQFWRDPATRGDPRWKNFAQIPKEMTEGIAAGFEYVGRRPTVLSPTRAVE